MERPIINKDGNKTSISFYTLNNRAENSVRNELENVFKAGNMLEMQDLIYTCIKELMVNASKTNIKKTFLVETNITEDDKERYKTAKKGIKKLMNDRYFTYLKPKLEKHSHDVIVDIESLNNGIIITVKNSTPMLKDEETKLRHILKIAMNNDLSDLASFYSDDADDAEGATLGMMLIINLLREMNINPNLFRIGVVDGITTARIEIPMNSNYRSIRKAG